MGQFVTFSRNVFIPLTNVCRNNCGYCGFRRDVSHPAARLMSPDDVKNVLEEGARSGCSEALFTFGERPGDVEGFAPLLQRYGFHDILDYLASMCGLALDKGLLPHSNPGMLSYRELQKLKPLNASMGLMLETTAGIAAHMGSPGKIPAKRLKTIEDAGRLKIPFTTGVLIGIGETREDRVRSLGCIRELHSRYGHIQEVIVQNFVPKAGTPMERHPAPSMDIMVDSIRLARRILPEDIAVQVAPNLIDPGELMRHGANDLGGISSVTIDHINPESKWPGIEELKSKIGTCLRERLPIYPSYVRAGWYSGRVGGVIARLSDAEGFRRANGGTKMAGKACEV